MKVVIIDDDKSSGKALADLLETKYDMEVLGCALCGLDGLAMVNRYQPDVLFLDVQLPDVNGLDFLDKLSGFVHRRCQVVMCCSSLSIRRSWIPSSDDWRKKQRKRLKKRLREW